MEGDFRVPLHFWCNMKTPKETVSIHSVKTHIHPGSAKVRGPYGHTKVPPLKGGFALHKKFTY